METCLLIQELKNSNERVFRETPSMLLISQRSKDSTQPISDHLSSARGTVNQVSFETGASGFILSMKSDLSITHDESRGDQSTGGSV